MIKALFFDIDGTLVNSHGRALVSTKKAIEQARQKGIICAVATGRGPFHLQEQIDHLTLDAFVTYNGQLAYNENEILYAQPFSKEILQKIVAFADENHRQIMFGSQDRLEGSSLMMMGQSAGMKRFARFLPKKFPVRKMKKLLQKFSPHKREERYSTLDILNEPIYQCVLLSPESETEKLANLFPECHFTRSNNYTVDIVLKGGSKFIGIKNVISHFGIQMEEVMAFGDSWNDCEMLQNVGVGVAMGNALPAIKELADHTTDTNDQDGIYKALVAYDLIEGK